jgi:hypothetical protein
MRHWPSFAELAGRHRWPSESARWLELVFCLVYRRATPEIDVGVLRQLLGVLSALGMLRIDALAEAGKGGASSDLDLFRGLLHRAGLEPTEADSAIRSVCSVAAGLQQNYGGKVQRYLREYGETMLRELPQKLANPSMADAAIQTAITHWLQNVLDMPIALVEPSSVRLCEDLGVGFDELAAVADGLDINLALVDDLIAASGDDETRMLA